MKLHVPGKFTNPSSDIPLNVRATPLPTTTTKLPGDTTTMGIDADHISRFRALTTIDAGDQAMTTTKMTPTVEAPCADKNRATLNNTSQEIIDHIIAPLLPQQLVVSPIDSLVDDVEAFKRATWLRRVNKTFCTTINDYLRDVATAKISLHMDIHSSRRGLSPWPEIREPILPSIGIEPVIRKVRCMTINARHSFRQPINLVQWRCSSAWVDVRFEKNEQGHWCMMEVKWNSDFPMSDMRWGFNESSEEEARKVIDGALGRLLEGWDEVG